MSSTTHPASPPPTPREPAHLLERRFWELVETSSGCWTWRGTRTRRGYGVLRVDHHYRYAHRVAWELSNGPLPRGRYVLHTCGNPTCVRPAHLHTGARANEGEANGMRRHPDRVPRGERNGRAVLTATIALEIRQAYAEGARSLRALASAYGISHETVRQVVNGQTWRHLRAG